jgi:hypothetical protein
MYGSISGVAAVQHLADTENDAYGLFRARSIALGWLAPSGLDPSSAGLWEMNDAGDCWHSALAGDELLWVQVSVPAVGAVDRPPVSLPFVCCIFGALASLGETKVSALEVALPFRNPLHDPREPDDLYREGRLWLRGASGMFEGAAKTLTDAVRVQISTDLAASEAVQLVADSLVLVAPTFSNLGAVDKADWRVERAENGSTVLLDGKLSGFVWETLGLLLAALEVGARRNPCRNLRVGVARIG